MTRFRRGFKAEAERLALDVRAEVDASAYGRLAPERVADAYGIPLLGLSDLAYPESIGDDGGLGGEVSAVTVVAGPRRLIVVNDRMSRVRQRSAVAHELAHLLLEHEPETIAEGRRESQPAAEAEADWLAGCLLVPKGAAIGCAMAGMGDRAVAARYGTSVALARWRMNASGSRVIARRARAPRPGSGPRSE